MDAESIMNDRTSGSTEICGKTCALLSKMPVQEGEAVAKRILEAHKPMALLHSCIMRYLNGEDISDFMEEYEERLRISAENALEHLKGRKSVMTISSSSAVEMTLSDFDGRIFVMESRPMLEGTMMAERLAEKGRDVTVVSDAYGISMVAKGDVDAVIVGADAIYRNMLINKVGTYALSVAARHSGTDFIAVLTTDKIFPDNVELSENEIMQYHDPEEITEKVRAINPYFEAVPIRKGMKVFMENELYEG